MTKLEIDLLILDYLNGVLPDEKETLLRNWVNSSDENTATFSKTCAYWELSTSLKDHKKYNTDKGWKKLSSRITPKTRYLNFFKEYSKIAAVFIFAFFLGYSIFQLRANYVEISEQTALIINEVPLGSKSLVTLPDGSKVWLNAGSKLEYAADFNQKNRIVKLAGEAFFDVATNKLKPFLVKTNGIKVKATGTQFNVRAYCDEDFIETTLVEGIVSVNRYEAKKDEELTLTPNQKLTVYKDRNKSILRDKELATETQQPENTDNTQLAIKKVELISNVETRIYTSWKDEDWIIQREKLKSLAEKLERRYDAHITFLDESAKDHSYSGTLKDETLEQVLHIISQTSPIQYKLDKKNVTIWHKQKFN